MRHIHRYHFSIGNLNDRADIDPAVRRLVTQAFDFQLSEVFFGAALRVVACQYTLENRPVEAIFLGDYYDRVWADKDRPVLQGSDPFPNAFTFLRENSIAIQLYEEIVLQTKDLPDSVTEEGFGTAALSFMMWHEVEHVLLERGIIRPDAVSNFGCTFFSIMDEKRAAGTLRYGLGRAGIWEDIWGDPSSQPGLNNGFAEEFLCDRLAIFYTLMDTGAIPSAHVTSVIAALMSLRSLTIYFTAVVDHFLDGQEEKFRIPPAVWQLELRRQEGVPLSIFEAVCHFCGGDMDKAKRSFRFND